MSPTGKSRGSIKRVTNNKSQSSQQIIEIVSLQSPSLHIHFKLMKRNMKQYGVMVLNVRMRKFRIDLQKFAAQEVFTDFDETEEESKENYDNIVYGKVPLSLVLSK